MKTQSYIEIFRELQKTKPLIAEELFITEYFFRMNDSDIEVFFLNPETKSLRKKIIEVFEDVIVP